MKDVFERDEVNEVLRETFYRREDAEAAPNRTPDRAKPIRATRKRKKKPKPDHYEVICISMYKEDLARLDAKVAELKRSGHRKMNRSALIRFALDTMDPSKLPKSY